MTEINIKAFFKKKFSVIWSFLFFSFLKHLEDPTQTSLLLLFTASCTTSQTIPVSASLPLLTQDA